MFKVGLTGGYASGKTFVAAQFARLGCHLIYADQLGHAVLQPSGEAYASTVEAFGLEILSGDGTIDRKKLASLVFKDPELLDRLTSIVHPAVFRLEDKMLSKIVSEDPQGIVMIEAAILVETGRFTSFDRLVVTACDAETQIARGMKRDGCTRQEAVARIAKQLPIEEKKAYADFVIDTGGTKEDTVRQVEQIYCELREQMKP